MRGILNKAGLGSGFLTVLLALALSFRVISAPFVFAAPAPDLIAICSGGQIVYVSLEDGQPVETETGESGAACPYFGVMSVLLGAQAPEPFFVRLAVAYIPSPDVQPVAGLVPQEGYNPRAPPLLS